MNSLQAATSLAARGHYQPVPELLLLAGEELTEARRPSSITHTALANHHMNLVSAAMGWLWRQTCIEARRLDEDDLLCTASCLDRTDITKILAGCLQESIRLRQDSPFQAVPLWMWASYVSSAALARLLLLIGAGYVDTSTPHPTTASLEQMARLHLRTVCGCFWLVDDEDPVQGLAGWTAAHADDPTLLVSAMVVDPCKSVTDLRWSALLNAKCFPLLNAATRLRAPFQVEPIVEGDLGASLTVGRM